MTTTYKRSNLNEVNNHLTPKFPLQNGVWSWFSDPRAVRYKNNTYYSYVSSTGDVMIAQYNHITGVQTTYNLHATLEVDDHDYCSILIRPDGKIQVFYSRHAINGDPMYFRISTNAEDISDWGAENTSITNTAGTTGFTYSNPFYLSAEQKYFVFWRGGDYQPNYATSTDGITWTAGADALINNSPQRPYVKYASNGVDTIHFLFTDCHPDESNASLYYCYYKAGNLYKADGTLIRSLATAPMNTGDGDVIWNYSTLSQSSWCYDISMDSNGYPCVAYTVFPSTTDHRYRYARWSGSAWVNNEVISEGTYLFSSQPHYSGGICIDHQNPNIVYFSKQTNGMAWEVFKGVTSNNGVDWQVRRLTPNAIGPNDRNLRPISVINANGDFDILWMRGRYTFFTNYNMRIVSNL